MDLLKKCFRKSHSIIFRTVGEEIIIITPEGRKRDLEKIYIITGVGVCMWNLVNGKRSLGAIRNRLLKEFDVSPNKLDKDLILFIKPLIDKKLIEFV
ncbi:PqqD family protein [Candidatus Omnitrophota bacterium]